MPTIYHITNANRWATAASEGTYEPDMFPVDGFIHCSKREQVIQVANLRFRSENKLVLLCIDTEKVRAEIIYENLEGGEQLFPHIYGSLNNDAVTQVVRFQPGPDGYFAFPDEIGSR